MNVRGQEDFPMAMLKLEDVQEMLGKRLIERIRMVGDS